jgi:hypothetical protein
MSTSAMPTHNNAADFLKALHGETFTGFQLVFQLPSRNTD